MNNLCHLNLLIMTSYHSSPNLKLSKKYPQDVPTATAEAEVALAGTSAPLLTNPSLTDMPIQDTEARNTGLSSSDELAARHNVRSMRGSGAGSELLYLVLEKQQILSIRFALARAKTRSQRTSSRSHSSRAHRTLYHLFTANSSWNWHTAIINYIGSQFWCAHSAAHIGCWPRRLTG